MSYGPSQEKHLEVTRICMFTVTRRRSSEGDQRTEPSDPEIILSKRVQCARLESNTVMTEWVTRTKTKYSRSQAAVGIGVKPVARMLSAEQFLLGSEQTCALLSTNSGGHMWTKF